jgi:hypothetical protein
VWLLLQKLIYQHCDSLCILRVLATVYWTHAILVASLSLVRLLTPDILTFWHNAHSSISAVPGNTIGDNLSEFFPFLSSHCSEWRLWDTFNEICCCRSYTRPNHTHTVDFATPVFIFTNSVVGKDTLSWFRFLMCKWKCDLFGRKCCCERYYFKAQCMFDGCRGSFSLYNFFRISVIWTFGLDVLTFLDLLVSGLFH